MFKLFLSFILLLAGLFQNTLIVPSTFTNAQQNWSPNLFNLFSDNFRNLLQQVPSAPLSNILPNPLVPSLSNSPIQYAYNKYSRSKDLQYSDEDLMHGGLNTNQPSSNPYLPAYNSFTNLNTNHLQNNDYNYHSPYLNQNLNNQNNYNLPVTKQFDDDPLYDSFRLAKSRKNLESSEQLNKNVLWNDDYSNIDLNAYNLDNIYNNRFNYNRLPVIPEHISFLPPPPSIPSLSNQHLNQAVSSNLAQYQQKPSAQQHINDLQQSSGSNSLVNSKSINTLNSVDSAPTPNQLQTPYSSFLANKPDLSNYNTLPLNQPPVNQLTTNSVELQYEQAKPFKAFIQSNEIYPQDTNAKLTSSSISVNNLPAIAPSNNNLQSNILPSLTPNSNVPQQPLPSLPTFTLPESSLHQLYQQFANVHFNDNKQTQFKNPSVIYYDNFINHQAVSQQPPISSASLNVPAISADPTNSSVLDQPLVNQLTAELGTVQAGVQSPSITIQPTNNNLNNLDNLNNLNSLPAQQPQQSNLPVATLEVTTKPQLNVVKAVKIKKPVKIKRTKNRTNQRDFGSRRRKDELEAIEK